MMMMFVLLAVNLRATEIVHDVYRETQETTFLEFLHFALRQKRQSGMNLIKARFHNTPIDKYRKMRLDQIFIV